MDAALTALDSELDHATVRAAQRLADQQLLAALIEEEVTGPRWRLFQLDAAEYAIAVFMRWVRTGEVYARAAARRRVVRRPSNELSYEERLGLVNLIVAFGLKYFREHAARQWRADGGAALRTYLIGACLLQFKAAFEAWRPDTAPREIAGEEIEQVPQWTPATAPSPDDEVVLRERTWGIVDGTDDPINKRILVCYAAGLNYPETAAVLGGGLTGEAVCKRVERIREKHEPGREANGRPS